MKTDEKQIRHGVALLAVIILILAITGGYMAIDRYLVGDEVVTYGMANSTDKGWMLSTGRIRAYFEERDSHGLCTADNSKHYSIRIGSRQKTGGEPLIFRIPDRKNAAGMGKSRSADGSRFVRMSAFIWGCLPERDGG